MVNSSINTETFIRNLPLAKLGFYQYCRKGYLQLKNIRTKAILNLVCLSFTIITFSLNQTVKKQCLKPLSYYTAFPLRYHGSFAKRQEIQKNLYIFVMMEISSHQPRHGPTRSNVFLWSSCWQLFHSDGASTACIAFSRHHTAH